MSTEPSVAEQATLAVRFMLDADAAPGLLPRLLQPFAKRDLVPDRMWSHRSDAMMHVEIAMSAMPREVVHLVEGNLRQVVGVRSVVQVSRSGKARGLCPLEPPPKAEPLESVLFGA